MAAASVESSQSLPKRCPWGRLGSVLDVGSRLRRMRRFLGPSEGSGGHCKVIGGLVGRSGERIGRNMLEAAAYAV